MLNGNESERGGGRPRRGRDSSQGIGRGTRESHDMKIIDHAGSVNACEGTSEPTDWSGGGVEQGAGLDHGVAHREEAEGGAQWEEVGVGRGWLCS